MTVSYDVLLSTTSLTYASLSWHTSIILSLFFCFGCDGCQSFYIIVILLLLVFFFFQAEDGIRDLTVTGVQTCALPIYPTLSSLESLLTRLESLTPLE